MRVERSVHVLVTVISSVTRRHVLLQAQLRGVLGRGGMRFRYCRCRGKRTFLGTSGRRSFAILFLSVCVSKTGKVRVTHRFEGAGGSYLLVFAAASLSRTLRNFGMHTVRCLMGPCARRRLTSLVSRVLSQVPTSRGGLAIGMGKDSLRVPFGAVIRTSRFSRVVRVRAAGRGRLIVQRSFKAFATPLGRSSHFFVYGEKAVVGVRRTISFSKAVFLLSSKDGVIIDERLYGPTQRRFVSCLFRGKKF